MAAEKYSENFTASLSRIGHNEDRVDIAPIEYKEDRKPNGFELTTKVLPRRQLLSTTSQQVEKFHPSWFNKSIFVIRPSESQIPASGNG